METGIELIAQERQRQIEKEGFTSSHDDQYQGEVLEEAAVCYIRSSEATHYLSNNQTFSGGYRKGEGTPKDWPWSSAWWKPSGDAIIDLVKAGALIAAAIDVQIRKQGSNNFERYTGEDTKNER